MSSGPENRFIQSLHRLLPAQVYRMKNHNPYNSGIADCWYSGDAGDLWVEYKYEATLPKTRSVSADLAELQKDWLRKRYELQGPAGRIGEIAEPRLITLRRQLVAELPATLSVPQQMFIVYLGCQLVQGH